MKVGIIFGSQSDLEIMKGASDCLKQFGIEYSAHILSAHRVPELLAETLAKFEQENYGVIIAGAGLSAHLPGVVASKTTLPVIGVPINAGKSAIGNGIDALYSIVQMPKSIPVASVGINNSFNAGMLAVQMLAIGNADLQAKLADFRTNMKADFKKNMTVEL